MAESRITPRGAGPAVFLAAHPWAYGLSLAGSGTAAVYGIIRARQEARHRVMWLALGANFAAQFVGIVVAAEAARHRGRLTD